MTERIKSLLKPVLDPLRPFYHFCVSILSHAVYGFPSRKLTVIGVTGTKGKSSTTELLNAILEHAGKKTMLINSIRFKVAEDSKRNMMRMSMPGRFFIAHLMSEAVKKGCEYAVIEMTSEGAKLSRMRGIDMDGLIFLNLAPEHIESHGSLQHYKDAKFSLGLQLVRSVKRPRIMVTYEKDPESERYLALPVDKRIGYRLENAQPTEAGERGGLFTFKGETIAISQPGEFSLKNALAAASMADALGIPLKAIKEGLASVKTIPGRAERIDAGQDFDVVVDYAHTPDSLEALYKAYGKSRKICVLGSMGGGRDTWKRPVMGRVAADHCDVVILTNEDPCDEDPETIISEIKSGIERPVEIIIDRKEAIEKAIEAAHDLCNRPLDVARGDQASVAVLITGKGTDPNMYLAGGKKIPWSDADVARGALRQHGFHGL